MDGINIIEALGALGAPAAAAVSVLWTRVTRLEKDRQEDRADRKELEHITTNLATTTAELRATVEGVKEIVGSLIRREITL